jgi:hypothetical protein
MCILKGFSTTLAKNTTALPFGVWFADATTLYVTDEGNGTNTYDPNTDNVYGCCSADHCRTTEVGL